jgi:hypothetical protein
MDTHRVSVAACVIELTTSEAAAAAAAAAERYESRFRHWDGRASVRRKPRRLLSGEQSPQVPYFPPELVPVARHPLVAALGGQAPWEMTVHRLYQYLHFTTELEQIAVMPVVAQLSRDRFGLPLPERMRADAFKIATDEAWHAQFSYDLMAQVREQTGVPTRLPGVPSFVGRLDAIGASMDDDLQGVESLIFSIVSETLISAILSDIPQDRRLPTAVREVVADHAEDEGRHHAYFRSMLTVFWSALDARQRSAVGRQLPAAIWAFLEPDYSALGVALSALGLPPDQVAQVVAESYPPRQVRRDVAQAARSLLRYVHDLGALDDPRTYDEFAQAGLLAR